MPDIAGAAAATTDITGMIGDINLFLLGKGEAAEAVEAWASLCPSSVSPLAVPPLVSAESAAASPHAKSERQELVAELMVMIAEPAARRRGAAAEAVELMMEWARRVLGVSLFVAKISESNTASLALFSGALGFVESLHVPAFREVHLMRGPGSTGRGPAQKPLSFELIRLQPPTDSSEVSSSASV